MDLQRLKKPLLGVGIVLALLILGLIGYQVFSNQDDRPFYIPVAGGDAGEEAVSRKLGFNLCKALLDNGEAQLLITDPTSDTPKLTLVISANGRWNRFSKSSQRDIGNYIKYTVSEAKVLVSQYIPDGQNNPEYQAIFANVQRRLCTTCWAVMENGVYVLADDKAWQSLPNPTQVLSWHDFQVGASAP